MRRARAIRGERRQGIGDALLDACRARAASSVCRRCTAHHSTPAGAASPRASASSTDQRIVRSLLDLTRRRAAGDAPPAGWALVTWLDRVPDEHLAAFVAARAAMDDAPTSDEIEFPTWTASRSAPPRSRSRDANREMRVTVAMRDDGEIGAFTELRVSRGSTLGFTDDTGTVAAHRGQGLARAVKLESLRRLREDHPEIESSARRTPRRTRRCATSTSASASGRARSRRRPRFDLSDARSPATLLAFVPRNRTVRLAVLGSSVQRAAPSGFPSSRSSALKRRIVVGFLVLALTRPDHGLVPVVRARRRAGNGATVLRPFEVAADRIARPFADTIGWFRGLVDAKSENEKLRAQNEALRRQLILDEGAIQENVQLRKALNYKGPPSVADFDRCTRPSSRTRRARSTRASSIGAGTSDGVQLGSVVVEPIGGPDGSGALVGTVDRVTRTSRASRCSPTARAP